jgi:hypothetical protein
MENNELPIVIESEGETVTILDVSNIEVLLQDIKSNQLTLIELQNNNVIVQMHNRELLNNITVGLGLSIALVVMYKLLKIFL